MKNFKNDPTLYRDKINKYLEKFFEKKVSQSQKISDFSKQVTQSLADYTMRGGKRLRPILFLYAYEAANGKINEEIIKLSIFFELIQSSLLIHDDLIDNSDLRRGKETIHKEYDQLQNDLGQSMAVLIGDIALNYVYEIIVNAKITQEQKNNLIKTVSNYINQVNYGQVMDVVFSKNSKIVLEDIEKVNYYKTVTYTTLMPMLTGAILANADKKNIKALSQYAINFGLAFQILDDVMGVFGEEKQIGKSVMSDVTEGKKTFLMFKSLSMAKPEEKKYILSLLGNNKISLEQYDKLKCIIYKTGALNVAIEEATRLMNIAINKIKKDIIPDRSQKKLISFAMYVLHKDKLTLNFRQKI